MSRPAPGSARWWQDTALITLGGVALAIWLWDGPVVPEFVWVPTGAPAVANPPATDLGDLLDAGCLTQDHLRALAEGRRVRVTCVPDPVLLRDLPPDQRPFP